MKFLLDQDVYASTLRFLRDLGHDVIPVAQIGLSQAGDEELLRIAQEQGGLTQPRPAWRCCLGARWSAREMPSMQELEAL